MSREQAIQVMRDFGLSLRPIGPVDGPIEGGFSGAQVFQIRTGSGMFALRRWPSNGLPVRRLRGLHRLLTHIWNSGLHVTPVPKTTSAGDTLVEQFGTPWQLEPWQPGCADFHDKPTLPRLRAALDTLARWHQAAATFSPTPDVAEWFARKLAATSPAVIERIHWIDKHQRALFRLHESWQGIPRLHNAATAAQRDLLSHFVDHADRYRVQLTTAARCPVDLQPCLRDIWHDHVLFEGETVTGIIDPSACRSESVAADLARLIGSLVDDDEEARQVALDAYAIRRPLTNHERSLFEVLDKTGALLSGMEWIRRRYVVGEQLPPAAENRLQQLAQRIRRWD